MLVCAVFGLCHGASTQVEFCFLFLGGPSVSFFSFLAPRLACPCLCLCVCVCVCFRKSCFVLSAALAWFRFAGPSLPPSLPPSRAPLSGARGAGGSWDVTGAPLSAHPAPSPRRPPASPWHVPPPPWNRVGDRVSFVAASRGEISRLLSLPLRPGSRRVASRRSAAEAPGRARAFGRPALWRPRRPATATRPRDVRAGCREPPGGRLYIVPRPPELRRALQEGCDSAAGPEAELSVTGYAGGDSPGGAEA